MEISVQYLEGGTDAGQVAPQAARASLRAAFERVPIRMVLLGWDLPRRIVEACAEECARHHSDLYLWQPLLTGHGAFRGDEGWRVVGPNGKPLAAPDAKLEFTFLCPNQPSARASILQNLNAAIAGGYYRGVFLDRIRFPSPAADIMNQLGCFCEACQAAARDAGLDLEAVQRALNGAGAGREQRHAVVATLLGASSDPDMEAAVEPLRRMLQFRERSISRFVRETAEAAQARGLQVGLDCFSPSLARMVGQDLAALGETADWIKVMTYARAFAPASLPYEMAGLIDWLRCAAGETDAGALGCIARATGWQLPPSRQEISSGELPASVLTAELQRGRSATPRQLLAGIELVEMPGVTKLSTGQMRADAAAVRTGTPDGVVLCWDLRHIPMERVELARELYGS